MGRTGADDFRIVLKMRGKLSPTRPNYRESDCPWCWTSQDGDYDAYDDHDAEVKAAKKKN